MAQIEIDLRAASSQIEVDEVEAVVKRLGVSATVTASQVPKGIGLDLTQAIWITLRDPGILRDLSEHFEDVPRLFRELFSVARRHHPQPADVWIEVWGEVPSHSVVVTEDLPQEALDALTHGDFPRVSESGIIDWDETTRRWRDQWERKGITPPSRRVANSSEA